MGNRICIRLTDGDRTSPLFYGHWCGISALKDMSDALRDENNGMMNIMCNLSKGIEEKAEAKAIKAKNIRIVLSMNGKGFPISDIAEIVVLCQ